MTKAELIVKVSEEAKISKRDAQTAINTVFGAISDELAAGRSMTLTGFGTFEVVEKQERLGRNPQTGEKLTIAAHKVAKFRAGKSLKDRVNG